MLDACASSAKAKHSKAQQSNARRAAPCRKTKRLAFVHSIGVPPPLTYRHRLKPRLQGVLEPDYHLLGVSGLMLGVGC